MGVLVNKWTDEWIDGCAGVYNTKPLNLMTVQLLRRQHNQYKRSPKLYRAKVHLNPNTKESDIPKH